MNQMMTCRCGWNGSAEGAAGGFPPVCPSCHAPLTAAATISEAGTETAADEAGLPQNPPLRSAPPALLTPSSQPRADQATLGKARHAVVMALGYVLFAMRFYVEHLGDIWTGWRVWINENMPSFDTPDAIRREIRISLDEQEGVHEEGGIWKIELPPRCVVCGGKAPDTWCVEPHKVLDPYGPIVGPLAGVIVGIYLSWWNGSLLWLLGSIFVGMLVGFAGRKDVFFSLKFKRCAKHAEPGRVPEVILLHRYLVIRVGARDVKLAFLQRDRDVGAMDEIPLPSALDFPQHSQTIPLADDVHPEAGIVPEEAPRLPTAIDENAPTPPGPDEYRIAH